MTQTWLITGSARGLGRALAEAVLEAGHNLVATARVPEQLADLTERFDSTMVATALDVTDEHAATYAVALAIERFGGLALDGPVQIAGPPFELGDDDRRESIARKGAPNPLT